MPKGKAGEKTPPSQTRLGAFLRERREHLGLSKAEVARRAGIGKRSVERYEKTTVYASPKNLRHIAAVLRCPVDALLILNMPHPLLGRKGAKKHQPVGLNMVEPRTELGRFLRTRRLELGLSQTEMARKLGMPSYNNYARAELGTNRPTVATVKKIAEALQRNQSEIEQLLPSKPIGQPQTALSKRIRERREALGLTREELASRTGFSAVSIASIERNREALLPSTARSLAAALELPSTDLAPFAGVRLQPTASALGQRVRRQRLELGLSLELLGQRIGVTRESIRLIEIGENKLLDDAKLQRLANVLHLDVAELRAARSQRKMKAVEVDPSTLGGFLAARRLALRLPRRRIKERVGISTAWLSQIEHNRGRPNRAAVRKLEEALGCTVPSELLPPEKEKRPRGVRPGGLPPERAQTMEKAGTLSAMLRARREELGLTQRAAAKRAGIGTSTIGAIERDIFRPSAKMLGDLERAFEWTVPDELRQGLSRGRKRRRKGVRRTPHAAPGSTDARGAAISSADLEVIKTSLGIEDDGEALHIAVKLARRIIEKHEGDKVRLLLDLLL